MIDYENLKYKDRERRTYNYKRLRATGLNSREANRAKDFSNDKIKKLLDARIKYNKEQATILGGCKNE